MLNLWKLLQYFCAFKYRKIVTNFFDDMIIME